LTASYRFMFLLIESSTLSPASPGASSANWFPSVLITSITGWISWSC
jgi:hypothetical protein